MKTIRTASLIFAICVIAISCEKKDNDLHISAFEDQLHKAVNAYRDTAGFNILAHNFDVLSREAKAHAKGRADGSISESDVYADMEERWIRVYDKWGIGNVSNHRNLRGTVTGEITSLNVVEVAAGLVHAWASDSIGRSILEGDYTVHGPGESKASDGTTYVMHMMCKFNQ